MVGYGFLAFAVKMVFEPYHLVFELNASGYIVVDHFQWSILNRMDGFAVDLPSL